MNKQTFDFGQWDKTNITYVASIGPVVKIQAARLHPTNLW